MFSDFMDQGGPVLWVILVSGVAALFVFLERSLHLHRARIKSDDFLEGIFNILNSQSNPKTRICRSLTQSHTSICSHI